MSDELRDRVAEATAEAFARHWEQPPPEFMCDVDDAVLAVFAAWLRERVAAELTQPSDRVGRCRCGRSTVTSERSGRITALGMVADEIAPKTAEARADASLAPALAAHNSEAGDTIAARQEAS